MDKRQGGDDAVGEAMGNATESFNSGTSSRTTTLKGTVACLPQEPRSHEGMEGCFAGNLRQIPETFSLPGREPQRRHFDVLDLHSGKNVVFERIVHVSPPP
jgi:hypothetical protein